MAQTSPSNACKCTQVHPVPGENLELRLSDRSELLSLDALKVRVQPLKMSFSCTCIIQGERFQKCLLALSTVVTSTRV